jgi:hypothetical protein
MNDTDYDDDDNGGDENGDDDEYGGDVNDKKHVEGIVNRHSFFIGPPGKLIKEKLKEDRKRHGIWGRRFQKPSRVSYTEYLKIG